MEAFSNVGHSSGPHASSSANNTLFRWYVTQQKIPLTQFPRTQLLANTGMEKQMPPVPAEPDVEEIICHVDHEVVDDMVNDPTINNLVIPG